ncbi:molybdate ABC transporter substrate-binding protein [Ideonella sp. DXS29W]|uniref:Molybdate ABC transporter substrate-binding protein n=1 Tax=Ideonella lacteola TaxID=2984193 RepID=A0ABU9BP09_9BURK
MSLALLPQRLRRMLVAGASIALAGACPAAELTVSAASSLTNAFRELGPVFERAHPGLQVLFNFGASGTLLQQAAKGAPVDVLATADPETMDSAQAQGLIKAADRRFFASNSLVVIVPKAASRAPASVRDLTQPAYARIAIGVPGSVPVGRYTQSALQAAGVWGAIEPKMIGAQNVRQALDYVARAEVDAGFVYATDAALMPEKVTVAFTVPTTEPVRYPAAALAKSTQAEAARQFVEFLVSPPAQAVLGRHGFGQP